MDRKGMLILYAVLAFFLLIGGFCFGFSDKIELITKDIFGLGMKDVLAADPDYVPLMPTVLVAEEITAEEPEPEPAEEQPIEIDLSQPRVMIYCTHNAETYRPTDGVDKQEGQNSGIFDVATTLYEELLANGISAVLCDTIHDFPDWSKSYANSLNSIQTMQEEYPSLEVFIDVHRDAPAAPINSTIKKSGIEYAKIMLVVGSAERIEHPTWESNLNFAKAIGEKLDTECSGILRGVKVQSGRYNQHVAPKSILVEMGTNLNSLEQVQNSAVLLAESLSEILSE